MHMSIAPFHDRRDAGRRLADLLTHYARQEPIVIALPRGGVPVAFEIAEALGAPLEVIVVRKLGTPGRAELAMGAIGPGGVRVLNHDIIRALDIPDDAIDQVEEEERQELKSREQRFHGGRPFPDITDRTVILVDNGIATGSTVKAAIEVLHKLGVGRLVLAAAVLPRTTANELEQMVDDLIYLQSPQEFIAVGQWYEDFSQTTSDEVVDLLQRARAPEVPRPTATTPRATGNRHPSANPGHIHEDVAIGIRNAILQGILDVPHDATGIVLFAHGSGSSRLSSRNQAVARALLERGLGTLLFDLLTEREEARERTTGELRFNIPLLADRLQQTAKWVRQQDTTRDLPIGYFGASTGGGAAIMADANQPGLASAVVSRGGRPDLAGAALPRARAPTLLIVGGDDTPVIRMNREAMNQMRNEVRLEIVPHATHLFEEPGTLDQVSRLAGDWFLQHLPHATVAAH